MTNTRSGAAQARFARVWRRPPRWVFHVSLVPPTLALLWSVSVPGVAFLAWLGSLYILVVASVIWAARLITYVAARRRDRATGTGHWFLAAPALRPS